jgi:hypothetical protein
MVIWTPMSRKFVADRFKESHPKMLPRTQYKISKTPLNNNQAFAFLYQASAGWGVNTEGRGRMAASVA